MRIGFGFIIGFMLCAYALDTNVLDALKAVWLLIGGG